MKIIYFIILLFSPLFLFGQSDSIINVVDSLDIIYAKKKEALLNISDTSDSSLYNTAKETVFYDSLKTKLNKNKLTSFISRYLLVHNNLDTTDLENENFVSEEKFFLRYEGKIIRSIHYLKVDIVEGNVYDTLQHIHSDAGSLLDDIHIDTKKRVLRKNTILKIGDRLDPFVVADNERIIRNLNFITDVKTYITIYERDTNMVNIVLVSQDRFSIGIGVEPKDINHVDTELYDFNALGTGNEIRYKTSFYTNKERKIGHNPKIRFNNMFGTFIDGSMEYTIQNKKEELNTVFIKEFLSPETKYVGAIRAYNTTGYYKQNYYSIPDSLEPEWKFNRQNFDAWSGKIWQHAGYHHRNNLAISVRENAIRYTERPFTSVDSNIYFQRNDLFLVRLSLLRSTFIKTKKLYMFGVSEDLPVGYTASITAGKEFREFKIREYIGGQLLYSNYFKNIGFFSFNLQEGTFFHKGNLEDFVSKASLRYFTRLVKIGRYDFRQFITISYSKGKNLYSNTQRLNFSNDIRGLPNFIDYPTEKFILNFEPILFSPWNWIGFRFAFYGIYDLGFIATDSKNVFNHKNTYESIGVGIRLRNDNLAFNIIQLRIVFFPHLPSELRDNRIDYNSVKPRLYNDSELLKPTTVDFN